MNEVSELSLLPGQILEPPPPLREQREVLCGQIERQGGGLQTLASGKVMYQGTGLLLVQGFYPPTQGTSVSGWRDRQEACSLSRQACEIPVHSLAAGQGT